MDLPVKCVRCGYSGFNSQLIGGTDARELTLSNVVLGGACPRCGGDLNVLDGTYDFTGGVMTAFRGLGVDQLRDAQAVLRQSRTGDLDIDEAVSQLRAISETLAEFVQASASKGGWTTPVVIQTLLGVLQVVLAWMALHPNEPDLGSSDRESLRQEIQIVVQQSQPPAATAPRSDPADRGGDRRPAGRERTSAKPKKRTRKHGHRRHRR